MIDRKRMRLHAAIAALVVFCAAEMVAAAEYQTTSGQAPANGSTFVACGEPARRANSRMKSLVSAVDDVWSARIRVYESVAPAPPHARRGGCVFYNQAFLNLLLLRRLLVQDPGVIEPLLYAIMAHEVGHEMHQDFSPERAGVSSQTKELEADRFAGYTLEHLNIGLDNIIPYYSLAGDEFGGQARAANSHGVSMSRTAALKNGWDLAEWNQPEDSHSLTEGD